MSATDQHAGVTAVKAATPAAYAAAADQAIAAAGDVRTATAGAAAATLIAAVVAFLAGLRELHRTWLVTHLAGHGSPDDVAATVSQEMAYEMAFAQASADRLASTLPAALAITDPDQREAKVRALLAAEERYAQQRGQAMAERAFAALERASVRHVSPAGAFWQLGTAHNHTQGCVIGSTLVDAKARAGFRRPYAGELVDVVVASGQVLSITPHHPVLTTAGWVEAADLREGDQLIGNDFGKLELRIAEDHGDVGPIEQVVQTLQEESLLPIRRCEVGRMDFHGDGVVDTDVCVVTADRGLWLNMSAALEQQGRKQSLIGPDPMVHGFSTRCTCGEMFFGEMSSSARSAAPALRVLNASPLVSGHCGECESHRLRSATTDLEAVSEQTRLERVARDPRRIGEPREGLAGVMALREVVKIETRHFVGEVFNLTARGWYTANGIIVQNCLFMGGKPWPWAVLDRVHPPRHPGCVSHLLSVDEAIEAGLMTAGDMPAPRDAVRRAAGVVMEGHQADALLLELDVRDALVEAGVDQAELDRIAVWGIG